MLQRHLFVLFADEQTIKLQCVEEMLKILLHENKADSDCARTYH